MKRTVFLALIILITATVLFADVPERKEQFVYSMVVYDGDQYSGTFCRKGLDTIYLLADANNFIVAQKTFVYFWPITKEWRTDTKTFQRIFDGTLEVRGKGIETRQLEKQRYTYYVLKGDYGNKLKIATGDEAEAVRARYQQMVSDYYDSMSEYNRKKRAYEQLVMELAKQIRKLEDQGRDVSELREKLNTLEEPQEPARPDEFVVPPRQVSEAYIVNLPVGTYSVRFLTEEGKVMENSEKELVVFERNRSNGVGYEIIPGDKWTRPEESKTASDVIYVDGSTDLYFRPFYEDEYNDYYYKRLLDNNDTSGNPNIQTWKRGNQVPKATIEVYTDGKKSPVRTMKEEPFFVEQTKGSSLGYKIVPFDPEGAHKDREPSMQAFHLPVGSFDKARLRVLDRDQAYLSGSNREVRIIDKTRKNFLLLVLSFVPIAVMAAVFISRRRVYKE
jgi:hypothetical protein